MPGRTRIKRTHWDGISLERVAERAEWLVPVVAELEELHPSRKTTVALRKELDRCEALLA